jgi:hypothetical protein
MLRYAVNKLFEAKKLSTLLIFARVFQTWPFCWSEIRTRTLTQAQI